MQLGQAAEDDIAGNFAVNCGVIGSAAICATQQSALGVSSTIGIAISTHGFRLATLGSGIALRASG